MYESSLVPISLDGYVVFFAGLAVIIAVLFWYLQKKETQARKEFFAKFKSSELRMSAHQIGLVFRVIDTNENLVTVVPIWNGKSQIVGGKEKTLDATSLIPFDENRFF